MFKKVVSLLVVMVFALSFGVALVSADDDSGDEAENLCWVYDEDAGYMEVYCDGRINSGDIAAPIAVYYTWTTGSVVNDDGETVIQDVISGIEIWAINYETSVGTLVLSVPVSQINAALTAKSEVQIAANGAYTLNYSPSADAFWVTGPDYSFAWER
ncbi:MAG TPA: hypothetical protein VHP83_09360 [Aggregatilineaceae bacterium]|nr:hypothetical protein [Aggregatilineaceae bacterium]